MKSTFKYFDKRLRLLAFYTLILSIMFIGKTLGAKLTSYEQLMDQNTQVSRLTFLLNNDTSIRIEVGKKLPKIDIALLGDSFKPDSLNKKPILISFWDKRCVPCLMETNGLNRLYRSYSDRVTFLAISPNTEDELTNLSEIDAIEFSIIADAKQLIKAWHISAFPTNIFVDKNGIISHVKLGVPVKRGLDGKAILSDGEPTPIVFEEFSKILDTLLLPE